MVEAQLFGIVPVVGATAGDLASFTSAGLLADSGVSSAIAHDPATLYVTADGNDATAARGRSDLAFATLNAAVSAAVSGDTIRVGVGTFAPLTATLPAWVRIVGSGRPHVDSVTAPTTLIGGTVIQGPLTPSNDGFELWHCGVDCGSALCAALYGGAANDALGVSNVPGSHPTGLPQVKGVRVCDVLCLAQSATAAVHACRIENVIGATISGLETWLGDFGLALKGNDVNVDNVLATGHQFAGVIVKSDDYAPCNGVNLDNLVVRPLGAGTGGITIQSFESTPIQNVNISNVVLYSGLSFGFLFDATGGMSAVSVNTATINATTPVEYSAGAAPFVSLSNVSAGGAALLNPQYSSGIPTSQLYAYVQSVMADSPYSFWLMNEAPGSAAAKDTSTSGGTGVYNSLLAGSASGPFGGYLVPAFSGSGQYLAVPNPFQASTYSFTVEAWIKATDHGINQVTVDCRFPTSVGPVFYAATGTGYSLLAMVSTTGGGTFAGSVNVLDGNWHHLVWTYDGTYLTGYTDGVLDCPKTAMSFTLSSPGAGAGIGATYPLGAYFQGSIGLLALYESALSAPRVKAHYLAGT